MDARLLTRLTSVALVAVVGMGAGHLLLPTRADASWGRRAAFAAALALAGAVAGWRERREVMLERGPSSAGRAWPWAVGGAWTSMALGALAWWLVHR